MGARLGANPSAETRPKQRVFLSVAGILLARARIKTGDFSGNAVVTIEHELGYKWVQTGPREKSPVSMRHCCIDVSFAQPIQTLPKCLKWPFHGDNTGSNPVGDAN